MNASLTVTSPIHFGRKGKGRRVINGGEEPACIAVEPGRAPRVARLMALAIRFDELLRNGEVASQAELAALGQVTRARVSQIMNLLNLAPDIQEAVLFLPRVERGRAPIILRDLQPIAAMADWRKQGRLWQELIGQGK